MQILITVPVSAELKKRITRRTAQECIYRSVWIREAIEEHLKRPARPSALLIPYENQTQLE